MRKTGTVKWFNGPKGYGFIVNDDDKKEVFAHYSQVKMEGYKKLKEGQVVTYEVSEGSKGDHALDIEVK